MNVCLTQQQKNEFVKRGFSRRNFGRIGRNADRRRGPAVLQRTGDGAALRDPRTDARRTR